MIWIWIGWNAISAFVLVYVSSHFVTHGSVTNPKKISKSFRIAPDGHWQARPFTDRFGSSEADVLYQFPLVQGGTKVLLPTRCVDELYVNTAHPRGVSRVRELVP